jgi:hypothetical protein
MTSMLRKFLLLMVGVWLLMPYAHAQSSISLADAKNHVGENATICGNVAGTHYAAHSRGNPTFLNLDKPYPDQIFTILIWDSDRSKFGDPEAKYRH